MTIVKLPETMNFFVRGNVFELLGPLTKRNYEERAVNDKFCIELELRLIEYPLSRPPPPHDRIVMFEVPLRTFDSNR